jgi:hypothetical protein
MEGCRNTVIPILVPFIGPEAAGAFVEEKVRAITGGSEASD